MLNLAKRIARRLLRRAAVSTPIVPQSPENLVQAAREEGIDLAERLVKLRREPRLYVHGAESRLATLKVHCSRQVRDTLAGAEEIMDHRFDLLGSGPFQPVDPERPARGAYQPIDWYLDPIRGCRFPQKVPYKKWNLYEMRPPDADIKLPWELSRCQHWPTLGQAYLLSGDDRYAREIADQLHDFLEANPVGLGINWTCTMDVAIRAANWALALEMVRNADGLDEAFWRSAYEALYAHGRFIAANLENHYEVTSNHFLSNVVGLFYLSTLFHDFAVGREWDAFCRAALEEEMRVQILSDGADYESSIPYHRLVAELFLGAACLAEVRGEPLSASYRDSLRRVVAFLAGVLRPDGLMPQVGDADDGRLHIFTDFSGLNPQDPRHIFASAATVLQEQDWLELAGDDGNWEAAWWGGAPPAEPRTQGQIPANFQLYPEAGLAVMRENGHYLLITNGVVGTKGFGNHKHNDQLSFEYHHAGQALLVDPGSYVYTSNFVARNRFRSTCWHNTLTVDGVEQNEFREEWLFRMFAKATPQHHNYRVTTDYVQYIGSHDGYTRLSEPVEHHRGFRLLRECGTLVICDLLKGAGVHQLLWSFACAPGIEVRKEEAGMLLRGKGRDYLLCFPAGVAVEVEEGSCSPSYGIEQSSQRIVCRTHHRIDGTAQWSFMLRPFDADDSEGRAAKAVSELAAAMEK
ncbi:MAG: heparinase II/III family protein [Desulfobulbaceae bacterium]|nr:heparinase II/III family protein [Desulfobulbaceae bacterium]